MGPFDALATLDDLFGPPSDGDESTSALTTEFLALGNHRTSIRSEIAEVTEQVRRLQLDALDATFGAKGAAIENLSPAHL